MTRALYDAEYAIVTQRDDPTRTLSLRAPRIARRTHRNTAARRETVRSSLTRCRFGCLVLRQPQEIQLRTQLGILMSGPEIATRSLRSANSTSRVLPRRATTSQTVSAPRIQSLSSGMLSSSALPGGVALIRMAASTRVVEICTSGQFPATHCAAARNRPESVWNNAQAAPGVEAISCRSGWKAIPVHDRLRFSHVAPTPARRNGIRVDLRLRGRLVCGPQAFEKARLRPPDDFFCKCQ